MWYLKTFSGFILFNFVSNKKLYIFPNSKQMTHLLQAMELAFKWVLGKRKVGNNPGQHLF